MIFIMNMDIIVLLFVVVTKIECGHLGRHT